MSEVKPPTSASLRDVREMRTCCGLGTGCDESDTAIALALDSAKRDAKIECYAGLARGTNVLLALAKRSARRAALGQAAEIADGVAAQYHMSVPAVAVREVAAAIRALMEGE